jgi:hypothetical protein
MVQTQLENAVMHLFQEGFTPTPTSTLSDFLANEADFDGYEPATIASWSAPVLAGSAWAIYAPIQTFRYTFSSGVTNIIGGYWIETASGDLKDYTTFNPGESAAGPGQAIIRTPIETFPFG